MPELVWKIAILLQLSFKYVRGTTNLGAKAGESNTHAHDEGSRDGDEHRILIFHDEWIDENTSTPCQAATDGTNKRY